MSQPLVTVVVATWHSPDTLALALRSILAQTVTDLVVEVIGDHCTDQTGDIVRQLGDPRLRWRNLARHCGAQTWPNNLGLHLAESPWVAYCGHDDLWLPWHLESCLEAAGTQYTVAHDLCARLLADGTAHLRGALPLANGGQHLPPSILLHHRDCRERVGYWPHPETMRFNLDADFTASLCRREPVNSQRRLGVLKFPSHEYRLYDRGGVALPQAGWLERIQADPLAVEADLHREVALQTLEACPQCASVGAAARTLRTRVRAAALEWWGDRWPLPQWQQRSARRRYDRTRTRRGLAPADFTARDLLADVSEVWPTDLLATPGAADGAS